MRKPKHATVVAYVALAVAMTGTASAATGGNFLLGKSNKATATTTLTNTKGVPLTLKSKAGSAPLAVSSPTKVTGLNADKLDGLDSAALQNQAQYFTVPAGSGVENGTPSAWTVPALPSGPYAVWFTGDISFSLKSDSITSTATCTLKNGAAVVATTSGDTTRAGWAHLSATWTVTNPAHLTLSCVGADDAAPALRFWTVQGLSLTMLKVDHTRSAALAPVA